ncbi:hypothetical protein ABPG73_005234 [Tetrahymena malaccensis]
MSSTQCFLSQFDVFGSPYQYKLNKNKYSKQTVVGGLFSILLFGFILSYFTYLIIQIDSGQTTPQFIQYDEMSDQSYEYTLSKNLTLSIVDDLLKIEFKKKIQYFDIVLRIANGFKNQEIIIDSHYDGEQNLVFDLTHNPLRSNPQHFTQGDMIFIEIFKCSGELLRNPNFRCATEEELDQLFQQQYVQIGIDFYQEAYSIKNQNFYKIQLTQVFEITKDKINFQNYFCLKPQEIIIQKGLFFQQKQTYKQIYQFSKENYINLANKEQGQGLGGALIYLALRLQQKEIKVDQDYPNLDYRQKAQKVIKQNNEIESNSNHFNVNTYERWKRFLIPSFCLKRKKKLNQSQQLLNQLNKQLNKNMCFYEMQKEFLRLKTAVKLLLSPQQYAAIHMCGCDLIDYEKNSEIQQNQSCQQQENQVNQLQEISDKESNLSASSDIQNPINSHQLEDYIHSQQSSSLQFKNHLELMEKVDVDSGYRQTCLERFLKDIQQIQGSEQAVINQRILNSMIGIQGDKLDLRYVSEKKNNPHNYIQYQEYQNNFYKTNS